MTHADFEHSAVTDEARCGFLPMLAVMLGFTFFSASMVVGVKMANGLSFGRFAAAVLVSNLVLGVYCAALAFVASRTGLSVHLLSRRVFGALMTSFAYCLLRRFAAANSWDRIARTATEWMI